MKLLELLDRPGARNADAGSMALLIPVMFLFGMFLVTFLALGSALLGAFAGYWAARTRSPGRMERRIHRIAAYQGIVSRRSLQKQRS